MRKGNGLVNITNTTHKKEVQRTKKHDWKGPRKLLASTRRQNEAEQLEMQQEKQTCAKIAN